MTKGWRISISFIVLLVFIALVAFLSISSKSQRQGNVCRGLEVKIDDSLKFRLISAEEIKDVILKGYGPVTDVPIDSLDLEDIEALLESRTGVLNSEAYTTPDGVLHIRATEREPVLFLASADAGFFCDVTGFLFPLRERSLPDIPVIQGTGPVKLSKDYNGFADTENGRLWIERMIAFIRQLSSNQIWKRVFTGIIADSNGDLSLTPAKGQERFIFGQPTEVEKKFSRISDYYEYIAPSVEDGYYSTVDVRFDGQIVCRTD